MASARIRAVGLAALAVLAVLAALAAAVRILPATPSGRRLIAQALTGLPVGRVGRLSVEGIGGDPWSGFSVRRITLTDAHGVWLDARDARARWRPAGLLVRRADIESLTAASVTLLRPPTLSAPTPPTRLPVAIQIDSAALPVVIAPTDASRRRGVYDLAGRFRIERSNAMSLHAHAVSRLRAGDRADVDFDLGEHQAFHLTAAASEAAGGAAASLLGLAADQPVRLAAAGDGALSGGRFTVQASVGPSRLLDAAGAWNSKGGSAQGRVDFSASRLMAPYEKAVGTAAQVRIAGARTPDGLFGLSLNAVSDNLALAARGEADIGKGLVGDKGVAFDLKIADPSRIVAVPRLGPAEVSGRLGGDRRRWLIVGQARQDRVALGPYALARVAGPVRIEGHGGQIDVEFTANGEGGAGTGLAGALLGGRPRAFVQASLLADRRLLVRALRLDGAGLSLAASGSRGLLGGLAAKGTVRVSNLAAVHPGARGAAEGQWTASQGGPNKPWAFAFDARGRDFATGLAELDRLLGPAPRLAAKGEAQGTTLALASSTLEGRAGSAEAAGMIGPAGALSLKLSWTTHGPFEAGPLEIAGAARGRGDIGGALAAPTVDLLADFSAIDVPALPLRDAHLVLRFAGQGGGYAGRFALTGESAYGPARAGSDFRFAPAGIDLAGLDVKAAGLTASGAVSLRAHLPSSADLTFAVGKGAFLVNGEAHGRVKVSGGPGAAQADVILTASDAVLRGTALAARTLSLTASGPLSRLVYRARAEGESTHGAWRLAGSGLADVAGPERSARFAGNGRFGRIDWRTLAPAEWRDGPAGRSVTLAVGAGGGRADLAWSEQAGALTAEAKLADLDLGLLNEDYVGKLDGTIDLRGHGSDLGGRFEARLTGAGGRDMRGAAPIGGTIEATLGHGTLDIAAALGDGKGMKATGEVVLPTEASAAPFRIAIARQRPMHGRFAIDGELKPLWDLTLGGETTLSGRLLASGTLGGTLAQPRAIGMASLDGGRFADAATGLKLENVALRASLSDTGIDVSQFTASDGAKGEVSGSGRIDLYRDNASSFQVRLTGFRLLDNDLGQATASGTVAVNRAADGKARLAGTLRIDRAIIAPKAPTPSGVVPMPVVEIHKPGAFDSGGPIAHAPPAPVALDVGLTAPAGVFIRGRGLNLELSLNAKVGGTVSAPTLSGVARVVRGDYNFAGKRFVIDDGGTITLSAAAEQIRLNLTARRDDPSLSAVIRIQGTAARPVITLSSTPLLPQDEILSQLLFGTSAAQLSPLDAAQLASALAGLAGTGGFDIIGGLRNLAHLDRLAFASGATTGTTVSGGKYIRDNVYLEITGGGRQGSSAEIEWRVKRHLSLLSRITSQGDSQISVRWRKDY